MKNTFLFKFISIVLVIATLMVSLPLNVFAETVQGTAEKEVYIKSIKVAQANTKEQAKSLLEAAGYIFLDRNLNDGTGAEGVWIGYTTTTDPSEAIYDIKLMNTEGGYTLTSMDAVLKSQESTFVQMAEDFNCLVEEFVKAYEEGSIPAQKAYMALNFFRVVENEAELIEQNGLGYQIVNGNMTIEKLTNMILFCDGTIFDSVVKLLTMGVQVRTDNWMEALQKKGPYAEGMSYGSDDAELKRRAKQLLVILQLYAQTYNSMDKMGLVSGKFDDQGNIVKETAGNVESNVDGAAVSAESADLVKIDINRVKSYKLIFDELAKYKYGNETLKDFFCSLENEKNERVLYPLVSVLTDGEFAALSYGCFIELALGANAKSSDFEDYDELFKELTKDVKSLYLYEGVNSVLLDSETVIGFTDTASQHMALTGEYQFYEKESWGENVWETGRFVALGIGSAGMAVMAGAKLTLGIMSFAGVLTAATAEGATGFLAGLAKACAVMSGGYATLVVMATAALVTIVSYIMYVIDENNRNTVDWEKNPIPEYMYDVQEVGFSGSSKNEGIETDYIRRPVFVFYEAVRDTQGRAADLNARSADSKRWIAMYVSYDRPGDGCSPIKATDLLIKTGNGETPEGYVPVTRFGGTASYNLNQWDNTDTVNGIYMFYKHDLQILMDSDTTYYIYDVYLQSGESTAHCLRLLEAAGYTPLNINLSPSYRSGLLGQTPVFTYLGYKVTTNPNNAITDIRMEYGMLQGTVQLGSITYASCGNSAGVTLYATKYKAAGTPILASGLKCYNDRYEAEAGYEPVCFLSGGPAQSFNTVSGMSTVLTTDYFLYFLPETTFTDGETYLSGISYYYSDDDAFNSYYFQGYRGDTDEIIMSYLREKYPYKNFSTDTNDGVRNAMACYMLGRVSAPGGYVVTPYRETDIFFTYYTYNPYRAIYSVKGTELSEIPNNLTVDSQGYVAWHTAFWDGEYRVMGESTSHFLELSYNSLDMNGRYYVAGNPSKTNVYDPNTQTMTEKEPLIADFHLTLLDMTNEYDRETTYDTFMEEDYAYTPVRDIFSTNRKPITVTQKGKNTSEFVLFIHGKEDEKPYVSAITAVDRLTVFRAYGGSDAGIKRTDITNNMLLAQLANQGATNYSDVQASMHREIYALNAWNPFNDEHTEMNLTKFGYTRTDDADTALRDVFIYIQGFTDDEPPKTIQRGNVKYTLLCQLSGNLTGYNDAPAPGVYLYGTTDKKAGERITDVDFSDTPFKDGYETVRTLNGRSMWAELTDYMTAQKNNHFMSGAKTLYDALAKFFGFASEYDDRYYDNLRAQKYYYIHIKREGDDLRTQKPYIGNLYLSTGADSDKSGGADLIRKGILDDLFDQGAEAFLDFDLNSNVSATKYVYLGYSYTEDPDDAVTGIRPSHKGFMGQELTLKANGIKYYAVGNINLNAGAGGNEIYLYYTKSHHEDAGKPITEIRYCQNSAPMYSETDTAEILPVMRFDSWKPSDLNDGIGKGAIYLTVLRPFETPMGTYKAPDYGTAKTSTRKNASGSETGKYIAAMYVMDKNTIRQEKLASGLISESCTCDKISDQEVIDRLKQMGATTILTTPLNIKGGEYEKNNNKVFIGYSRTDDYKKAIKNIAVKAELLSLEEPDATMEIGTISYNLVAEAATKVATLPRAINLIGTQDGQDLLAPRLYLYTSTVGEGDPIYDICIDGDPIKSGWVTVISENGQEPFYDLYQQAKKQAELGDKDDDDSYDSELVYTDELYKWMEDVADTFDPGEEEIEPFFIHCKKRESNADVKEILPYISELYVAAGDNKLDALSQLLAYEPDGYLDYDLNKRAGGDYIYIAYKRTDIKSEAITDIVISATDSYDRIWAGATKETTVPYDLVSNVNLNSGVILPTASTLYLYTSRSPMAGAGQPVNELYINDNQRSTKDNSGLWTDYTALKLLYDSFYEHYYPNRVLGVQNGDPDLNDGAGGAYIYLVMKRYPVADNGSEVAGTLLGNGSVIAICVCAGIGVIAALVAIYVKRKKKQ